MANNKSRPAAARTIWNINYTHEKRHESSLFIKLISHQQQPTISSTSVHHQLLLFTFRFCIIFIAAAVTAICPQPLSCLISPPSSDRYWVCVNINQNNRFPQMMTIQFFLKYHFVFAKCAKSKSTYYTF